MSSKDSTKILLGDPKKAIRTLAVPLIISLLVAQINTIADRSWCSGLGSLQMAAIAVVIPIYLVFVGLGNGLGVGASAVISRNIGAGRPEYSKSSAVQAIIFGIIFGIVLTVVMLLVQSDFLLLIGSEDVLDYCVEYMMVYTLFIVLIILNGVISGILNGQGATKLSTIMMVVLAVSNIILDPIFIYGLDLGISGASLATVAATMLSLLLGIYFILHKDTYLNLNGVSFSYDKRNMRSVLVAGVPQMIEYAVMWGMNIVLNCIVISCGGSEGLTIYSTPDNLMDFIVIPAMAIGSALVPIASAGYGQKDTARMKKSFHYSLLLGIACVVGLAVLLEIFSNQVLMIFTYGDDMKMLESRMVDTLRIMCFYAPFFAFTPLCSGYLQALGKPHYSVICAIWRNLVLITFFAIAAQQSLRAIFFGLVFGHIVGAVTILLVAHFTSKKVFGRLDATSV